MSSFVTKVRTKDLDGTQQEEGVNGPKEPSTMSKPTLVNINLSGGLHVGYLTSLPHLVASFIAKSFGSK
jgi:hypothetical protein